ncbi:unnamed protein product [Leptidea sinapis]|uniref:Protein kinase domain-containing protein n=1 Tax=Leptidea sinapis TaxID=189913 RepID=A0A5E4Q4M6_9NEOP|nr:unnamed protein product [Leptidea sinapis]
MSQNQATLKRTDEQKKKDGNAQKKSPEKNMSEIDEHILKRFDIKKRLGKGAYGIVWKAIDRKTKDVVAIKKIFDAFRNQTDAQRTFREIIFLQSFRNHPNIVKLHSIHRALNNRDIYLGFEYMETDLHNVIKRGNILKDIHKRYIMYQMLKATKYIHSGNVIHRDQKPSNVLIDSACRVKIADFGLARSVSSLYSGGEEGADPCLTDYVATRYTKGIDMWSLGCILGEMLTGSPLFPDISAVCTGYGSSLIREQAATKGAGACLKTLLSCAPRDAAELVQQLLVFNPAKRLSAERALHHDYVAKFHRERDEPALSSDVLLPLRDDKQVSVNDYRNKLYSIMAKGFQNSSPLRKNHSSIKSQVLSTPVKSKSFQEHSEVKHNKVKLSASADAKLRMRSSKTIEKPLKSYQSIGEPSQKTKPVKATKLFEPDWTGLTKGHGDYFDSKEDRRYDVTCKDVFQPVRLSHNSADTKRQLQQRRNSTSFSTITIGDTELSDFGRKRHGVITASALMDLRTSIR